MHILRFTLPLALGLSLAMPLEAQLSQTFEDGEDTSAWNSSWSGGSVVATFLSEELGGQNAGSGTNATQSFSRSFKDNTAGLDLSSAYTLSMYVQLDTFDGPESGQFEIIDGDYGAGAAPLRVTTTESPGVFKWQAFDDTSSLWLDLDISLDLANPYRVVISVDPETSSYSAIVQLTDTAGTVLDEGSLSNLTFNSSVITNHQNGTLLFYIQSSAGGTQVAVDNIGIDGVPEPSTFTLAGLALGLLWLLRKKLTTSS